MGRFAAALCLVASADLQLFAAPALPAQTLRGPEVLAQPLDASTARLRGAVNRVAYVPVAQTEASGSAAKAIGAAICAGAAVFAVCSRGKRAAPAVRRAAAPTMVIDPSHAVDTASALLADGQLSIPIPAFSPAKAFVMMSSNLAIISGMTIQGKGLQKGIASGMSPKEAHDDMVNSFGLTWLLSGTALGHVVGAGAILGCEAGGLF